MPLKSTLFRMLRASGALRAVGASSWRRSRLLILCYHGVSLADEHEWNPDLYVTPAHLRRRLTALRRLGYRVLPLTEGVERMYAGSLPPRSVAVTFDDGTVDFARRAVPLLAEFGAPATVYLTTFYSERRLPVFDTALRYVLWRGRASGADLHGLVDAAEPLTVADADARDRAALALAAHALARGLDAGEKDALIEAAAGRLGVDYGAVRAAGLFQIMTPDEVRALPRDLVDVQLHTHRHRTPRDHGLFARELRDNAAAIRALSGAERPLEHFCYPSGEYFGEFLDWLPEQGVRYATTCVPDIATADAHPLLLPRFIDTTGQSDEAFEAWVSGAAALLPKRRAYRLDPARLERLTGASTRSAAPAHG